MTNHWPPDHEPYTDRYFLRSKRILDEDNINPMVSFKVFCRENFYLDLRTIVRITELVDHVPTEHSRFHIRQPGMYTAGEPLLLYEGPAQELIDKETVLLGSLSHILESEFGDRGSMPWPKEFRQNAKKAAQQYSAVGVPMLYFGARHYAWWQDKELAKAALDGGCVQTSTDIGSYNIYKRGVGTTPHALTIILAHEYGRDKATLATAGAFHTYMPEDVPRTILCDTFNQEVDDTLAVLEHLIDVEDVDPGQVGVRIDTCGENVAQSGRQEMRDDPPFEAGTGVKVEAVRNLKLEMMNAGYPEANLFVSSGMGNPDKAKHFVDAFKAFEDEHEVPMFDGVGAGNFVDTIQCTSDIYRVGDEWLAKAGREVKPHELERYEFFTIEPEEDKGLPNMDMLK